MEILPRSQFHPMVTPDYDGYAAGAQVGEGAVSGETFRLLVQARYADVH